jgi:hypothetical protein
MWLETLHVSVSSHIPQKADDLVSLDVSVSSHKPRKAEDLVSLHVSDSSHIPRKVEDSNLKVVGALDNYSLVFVFFINFFGQLKDWVGQILF